MTLHDVVERLDELDDEDIIYVRRPWKSDADCTVARYDRATRKSSLDGMDTASPGDSAIRARSDGAEVADLPLRQKLDRFTITSRMKA